jgi:homoserine O-acetyltransferase
MADVFSSSDSVRSGKPLRHAKAVTLDEPLALELGGRLPSVTVAYETYGTLNAARDNAVLIGHALSGDSHVARHDPADDPGWWDVLVGPGKPVDTDRWFVVCPNVLGGCRGTTGPNSPSPETGRPYGPDFPTVTIGDMVEVQRRLVDHLGIARLHAVVGGSMGGHQALAWATRHPDRVRAAVPLAASPRLSAQALAFDVVGRNAIRRDPDFRGGQYYGNGGPAVGLALARMLGHITYLSPQAMTEKFEADRLRPRDVPTEFEKRFSVGAYLAHQGDTFVERFDANSYITISMALDLFDLGHTPEELSARLGQSRCRWLVVSFTSDWLFPPAQSREIVDALLALGKPVSYCDVRSDCGHDAFLLEENVDVYGGLVRACLETTAADGSGAPAAADAEEEDDDVYAHSPTSIFHPHRLDYDRILDLVPAGASVLDVGCGPGGLLARLRRRGHARLAGIELDEQAVLAAVRRGLDVVQGDVGGGLAAFRDRQFDVVVLSQTLQAVRDVGRAVDAILRVGTRCVVSFPNFAYHKLRTMLADAGRAPESPGLLRYKWHDTPNIRFFSIADFEALCRERGITVHQVIPLDLESGREVVEDPNRNADTAIFVISR